MSYNEGRKMDMNNPWIFLFMTIERSDVEENAMFYPLKKVL
jgi:hypothetical protein